MVLSGGDARDSRGDGSLRMMPVRVQRKRTRGYRLPPNTKSVTRPGPMGNPFSVAAAEEWHRSHGAPANESPQDTAVRWFREWIDGEKIRPDIPPPPTKDEIRRKLAGYNLACYCRPGTTCHTDVLLEIANGPSCKAA